MRRALTVKWALFVLGGICKGRFGRVCRQMSSVCSIREKVRELPSDGGSSLILIGIVVVTECTVFGDGLQSFNGCPCGSAQHGNVVRLLRALSVSLQSCVCR